MPHLGSWPLHVPSLPWMALWGPLLSTSPRSTAPNEAETLLPAAARFPRDQTQQYSQGCCPENWRQMGSRLAHLMTTSCSASCACAQKERRAGGWEADSSPFALPKAEGFDKRTPTLGTYQSAI